ncbi:MAG: tetratricopeptide repeat protein [Alphaproteobacteria bacterium]|nr:tetratricopeptide repeat protein [Alphaproteobacteria bacterium]
MNNKTPPEERPDSEQPAASQHTRTLTVAGLASDEDLDVAAVALALAALDYPDRDVAIYRGHLAELCAAVASQCQDADHIDARADVLGQVISRQFGYAGDQASYNDMQNANLMQVIDRRKGLPVVLGLLYIIAARAQGWACAGLNFPGHFLIRLELGSTRRILDPFNGGVKMEIPQLRSLLKGMAGEDAELQPEYYQPVSNRDVLLRLLNNIKGRAFQSNDFVRACDILERMRMILPASPHLGYEHGMVHARLGNVPDAMAAMRVCIEHADDPKLRQLAEQAVQQLRLKMN